METICRVSSPHFDACAKIWLPKNACICVGAAVKTTKNHSLEFLPAEPLVVVVQHDGASAALVHVAKLPVNLSAGHTLRHNDHLILRALSTGMRGHLHRRRNCSCPSIAVIESSPKIRQASRVRSKLRRPSAASGRTCLAVHGKGAHRAVCASCPLATSRVTGWLRRRS